MRDRPPRRHSKCQIAALAGLLLLVYACAVSAHQANRHEGRQDVRQLSSSTTTEDEDTRATHHGRFLRGSLGPLERLHQGLSWARDKLARALSSPESPHQHQAGHDHHSAGLPSASMDSGFHHAGHKHSSPSQTAKPGTAHHAGSAAQSTAGAAGDPTAKSNAPSAASSPKPAAETPVTASAHGTAQHPVKAAKKQSKASPMPASAMPRKRQLSELVSKAGPKGAGPKPRATPVAASKKQPTAAGAGKTKAGATPAVRSTQQALSVTTSQKATAKAKLMISAGRHRGSLATNQLAPRAARKRSLRATTGPDATAGTVADAQKSVSSARSSTDRVAKGPAATRGSLKGRLVLGRGSRRTAHGPQLQAQPPIPASSHNLTMLQTISQLLGNVARAFKSAFSRLSAPGPSRRMLAEKDPLYRISGFGIIAPGSNGLSLRAVVTGIQRLTGSLTSLSVGAPANTDSRLPSQSYGASQANSLTGSWPSLSLGPNVYTSAHSDSLSHEASQPQAMLPDVADFVQKHSGGEVVYCDEDLVNCEVLYLKTPGKPAGGRIVTDSLVNALGQPLLESAHSEAPRDLSVKEAEEDISKVEEQEEEAPDSWVWELEEEEAMQERRMDLDEEDNLDNADANDAQGLEGGPQQSWEASLKAWEDALGDIDDDEYRSDLDGPAAVEFDSSDDVWPRDEDEDEELLGEEDGDYQDEWELGLPLDSGGSSDEDLEALLEEKLEEVRFMRSASTGGGSQNPSESTTIKELVMELADLYKQEARGSFLRSHGEPQSKQEAVTAEHFQEFPDDIDEAAMAQDDGLQWATDEARALEQEMELKRRAQSVLANHEATMMTLQELANSISSAARSDGIIADGLQQNSAAGIETPAEDLADFERFSADKHDSAVVSHGPYSQVGSQPQADAGWADDKDLDFEDDMRELDEDDMGEVDEDDMREVDERELVLNEMKEALQAGVGFLADDEWVPEDEAEELEERIQLGEMVDVGSWSDDGSSGIMPEPLHAGIEPTADGRGWGQTQATTSGHDLPAPSTVSPPEERLAQRYADMAVQAALRSAMTKEPSSNVAESLELVGVME